MTTIATYIVIRKHQSTVLYIIYSLFSSCGLFHQIVAYNVQACTSLFYDSAVSLYLRYASCASFWLSGVQTPLNLSTIAYMY